jgi:reactive intermediate/imine deaminase
MVKFTGFLLIFLSCLMANKIAVHTEDAPAPIGAYSQAIKMGSSVYLSGQIPLDPKLGVLVEGSIEDQVKQIFENLAAVAKAAGGDLKQLVKLTIFLQDLADFPIINTVMADYFNPPYPARSTIGVVSLPMGAKVEIEAIMVLE